MTQHDHPRFTAFHGDCVDFARSLPDESVDYSIFSPPFASLYTYSNSPRDMGNVKDDDEFLRSGRRFLGSELKASYYEQAVRNLQEAATVRQHELFSPGNLTGEPRDPAGQPTDLATQPPDPAPPPDP